MKLKSKIILICGIHVLTASLICSVAVYILVGKSFREAAVSQGFQHASSSVRSIRDELLTLQTKQKKTYVNSNVMEYIFKKSGQELIACFDSQEEKIYNDTVFGIETFNRLDYRGFDEFSVSECAHLVWEKQHYVVYRDYYMDGYSVYKLEDITYVWKRMRLLGAGLLLLTLGISIAVSLVLLAVLGRVLQPLQELNAGAKQIACGRYDERIAIERKDEIGELGRNFNRMAEAVEHQISSLEESENRKTLFMGNLTHELKTPLTAISGYAKTLLTVKLPEEDREEALSYIYGESCRLERLSKKMMELLLLEQAEEIRLLDVSARVLFHDAEEACRKVMEEKEVRLVCREDGEVFCVDADLFTEVLINLIDNAVKASSLGSEIILSAEENQVVVQDFGMGIPKDEQEKILEPFYMVDKSRSRKSGGAGLGLAITAAILERHNCRLQIESVVGEGTRMILQFV